MEMESPSIKRIDSKLAPSLRLSYGGCYVIRSAKTGARSLTYFATWLTLKTLDRTRWSLDGIGSPGAFSSDAKGLVRSALADDMAVVTGFHGRFVETSTATSEIRRPSEAEMLARRQTALNRGLPYLVAELDGYVVGFAYAAQFRPRDGYRLTVEDSIYIRQDCKGYGLGKMLLAELISRCEQHRCHSMVACICGVNEPSVGLHRSMGFEQVASLPETVFKFSKWLGLTMLQRRLVVT